MPKLTEIDWKRLRENKVAFWIMPDNLFKKLMKVLEVYRKSTEGNPGSDSVNPGEFDEIDELMFWLAHVEPPIQPIP